MMPLLQRLKKEILVCDGAMGTALQAKGLRSGSPPEEWNVTQSSAVRSIHLSYIDAGCDILITNTFGANAIKLKRAGLEDRVVEFNTAGAAVAKEAAGGRVYVLGDIGPTGEFLEPVGTYKHEQFYTTFLQQAKVLADSGVDAFIIETMSDLGELKTAISACKDSKHIIPVIASMTFQSTKTGFKTMMGVGVEQAVEALLNSGCDVMGSNCGSGTKEMSEIMTLMKKALEKAGKKQFPLVAQPNAGMPKLVEGKTVFTESAADFAKVIPDLLRVGVNIIGGCCGTTPEHIREIATIVKK